MWHQGIMSKNYLSLACPHQNTSEVDNTCNHSLYLVWLDISLYLCKHTACPFLYCVNRSSEKEKFLQTEYMTVNNSTIFGFHVKCNTYHKYLQMNVPRQTWTACANSQSNSLLQVACNIPSYWLRVGVYRLNNDTLYKKVLNIYVSFEHSNAHALPSELATHPKDNHSPGHSLDQTVLLFISHGKQLWSCQDS